MEDGSQEPVVLVNIIHVEPKRADGFASMWGGIIREFNALPGFISVQLHRYTAGSGSFLVYSVWERAAHYSAVMPPGLLGTTTRASGELRSPRTNSAGGVGDPV